MERQQPLAFKSGLSFKQHKTAEAKDAWALQKSVGKAHLKFIFATMASSFLKVILINLIANLR